MRTPPRDSIAKEVELQNTKSNLKQLLPAASSKGQHPFLKKRWGLLLLSGVLGSNLFAQPFTKSDSGWVPLFNGTNYNGLYSRLYNKPVTTQIDPGFAMKFAGTDSAEISVGAIGGEIGTVRNNYRHYRMRVQYRFDGAGNLNAGFLYAVDESYPRMGGDGTTAKGNWPRSIECQMLQGDGGDAFSIQQVTFDTRVTNNRWDPNGKAIKVCEFGCDGRSFGASPDKADKPGPAWNDMEVVVRGADTAIHIVNGKSVFKLWNIRITDKSGNTMSKWDSGAVGLEAESAPVHYRRWEIMELPESGPNFLNRVLVTKPTSKEEIQSGSTYTILWKSIGDFSTVKLRYQTKAGEWKLISDSAPNSGTYSWPVPSEATDQLRIRIEGNSSWIQADSSGTNTIKVTTSIGQKRKSRVWKTGQIDNSEGRRLNGQKAKAKFSLPEQN